MARAKQPRPVSQMTEKQFDAMFPDETACKTYLVKRRWPDGVKCPRCNNGDLYDASSYKEFHWQCRECAPQGYRFSVYAGTIFENTNAPLRDWFKVTHLMLTSKKGMSARQVHRYMGFGSYKTAWYMCHRIRVGLMKPEERLGGIVEMDETYIGGKDSNKHWDKRSGGTGGTGSGKTAVIGAVSRKGNLVARMISSVDNRTIDRFVHRAIDERVSTLVTDDAPYFKHLKAYYDNHSVIRHAAKQYVVGAIHTNTIEGFWSILKRGVVGTYHKVSAKYLPLYVAEFEFRYNNRHNPDIFGAAFSQ